MAGDRQERLGIIVYVQDEASGKLTRVKAEIASLGPAGATAGAGLARASGQIEKSATRIGGALSHAKGAIGGLLSGPLGFLGLTAGVLSVGGAFETGLSKAQTWGAAIEKLQGITHNSATQLSGLLAVTDRFGISSERLVSIAAFSNKAVGNLVKGLTDEGLALAGVAGPSDAVLKAQERLRVATIRLNEVESKRTHSLSSLVSAQNSVKDAQRALDKALGDGGVAVGGADKFVKDYGFDIRNADGSVKDFETRLLTFADYWKNGAESPAIKSAAAAKLFSKSWSQLVPILNLGKQGILDAADEAAKLGLVLTQDNVVALAKARDATRNWDDALGGLELQLGLGLLPKLTELATWGSSFVAVHGHDIVKFFTDLADFAGSAAGTIGSVVGAIAGAWNLLPPELRSIITTGLVADRTIHFLFGFSPLKFALGVIAKPIEQAIAGSALGKLAGGIFQRGSTPANPLFVSDVTKGAAGLLGAGEGAAAAAGEAGIGMTVGAAATALAAGAGLGLIMAAAAEWIIATGSDPYNVKGRTGTATARGLPTGGMDPTFAGPRSSAPYGSYRPPGASAPFRDSAEQHAADTVAGALTQFRADERADWTASIAATRALNATMRDAPWLSKLEDSWRKAGQTMHDKIKAAIAGLSGPHSGAAAAFLGSKLGNAGFGAGGYDQAVAVLATLKSMKQSLEVVAAEKAITVRLPRLKLDRDDLAAAEKIAQSSDPKNKKLDELAALERDIKLHGDATAHRKLQDIITAVKHQKLHTTNNIKIPIAAKATVYVSPDERPGRISVSGTALVQATQNAREYAAGGRFGPGWRLVGEHGPELEHDDRSGYIFDASKTREIMAATRSGSGLPNALDHVTNPTARAALERNLERLIAALEANAGRPHVARVSHRDFEAAQIRRQAVGPSRARQFALSGG